MAPNRPEIPATIKMEVMIESGHRCAVCGTPCPLERAHIIPWSKSKRAYRPIYTMHKWWARRLGCIFHSIGC